METRNASLTTIAGGLAIKPSKWWRGEGAITSGPRSIRAANDLEAVAIFLAARNGNKNTLSSYTKETRRLLTWCQDVRGKPLSSLAYDDILLYQAWLSNPGTEFVSPDRQLAGHGCLLFYKGGLSNASAKAAMRVVAALFNELEIGGYLSSNPVRLYMRHQKVRGSAPAKRREPIPTEILSAIEEWLGSMPGLSRERAEYGALVAALVYMGLRATEAASATLGGFHFEEAGGVRAYGFTVTGKRGKTRVAPVEDRTREAFEMYRFSLGEPRPIESPEGADRPLIGVATRSGVYYRVKTLCERVAGWLKLKGDPRATWFKDANIFPHRMRHTATRRWLDKGVSLDAAQDSLGHSSINTTRIYDNRPVVNRLREIAEKMNGEQPRPAGRRV